MTAPALSVVIPAVNGPACLGPCLDALDAQRGDPDFEVIVLDRSACAPVAGDRPRVRLLAAARDESIPALRRRGMRQARAAVIAVIEDHCLVPPSWVADLIDAHAGPWAAVGGPVRNGATERLVDRAAFLCEYHAVMPPTADGEVAVLPGNNVAYKRAALERVADVLADDLWEGFLHEALRRDGARFLSRAELCVTHARSFGLLEFAIERYRYSRSWSGMKGSRIGIGERAARALGAPLLLGLVPGRVLASLRRRRRLEPGLVAALPLVTLFAIPWAAGEVVGFLLGAGASTARVR